MKVEHVTSWSCLLAWTPYFHSHADRHTNKKYVDSYGFPHFQKIHVAMWFVQTKPCAI